MVPKNKDEARLQDTLDEAEWSWLKSHAQRDGLIYVSQGLDLLQVGHAISQDLSDQVKDWIEGGKITKPTQEQMAAWDQNPTRRFLSLVVQPYVLIQEILFH